MRTLFFLRNHFRVTCLVVLIGCTFCETAWSQRGGQRREGRGDPASLLSAYRDDKTSPLLNLTKEQSDQLQNLRRDAMRRMRSLENPEELAQAKKELEEKAVSILTNEQKQVWNKRKDEIQAEQLKADATETPANTDAAAKPASTNSSTTGGVVRTEGTPSSTHGTIPDEKPPEGAITVVSFGPAAAAKIAEAKQNPDAVATTANATSEIPKLSFNCLYAPWSDVLKLFAEVNDLSLDLNDVPPGTFNYIDNKVYTMTEALDVINGYLLTKGYVLVRRDRFLVCLNIDNKIPPNVVPTVTKEELEKRGKNELLSLMLPLEGGLDADKVVSEITPLLGPQGTAAALKSTNSLVLTDIGSNLRRVSQLLAASKPIDNRETAFKAIPLKHIAADVAERMVRRLFSLNPTVTSTAQPAFGGGGGGRGGPGGGAWGGGGWGGRGGGGGNGGDQGGGGQQPAPAAPAPVNTSQQSPFAGKIQVAADTRTNHLLVTANGPLLKVVEDVVRSLDTDTDATGQRVDMKNNPVYLKPYSVPGSDVSAVSRMLNNVVPGVVVGEDARAGKIYVQGTKEEHSEVQKIISQNSGVSSDIMVISLRTLDPLAVVATLRSLYVSEAPRGPSFEADAAGRRVIAKGNADQLSQIKTALREMGETSISVNPDANGDSAAVENRGTSRKLNLGNHDPEEILGLVQRSWGASGGSPIRIVIPSKPSPIKERRQPSSLPPISDPNTSEAEPLVPQRRESTKSDGGKPIERAPTIRSSDPRGNSGKQRDVKPILKPRPATTQIYPRRVPVLPAAQTVVDDSVDRIVPVNREPADDVAEDDAAVDAPHDALPLKKTGDEKPAELPATKAKEPSSSAVTSNDSEAPIGITVTGNDLILTSPDTKALDQLEEMVGAIIAAIPQRTRWTVFYLRTADATESAQMIEKLFPQSSVTTAPATNDSFFSPFGAGLRSVMNATGLNQTLGGSQNLRIITDVRSNALFVTGPRDVIRDIEYVLELLDANELPGTMRERFPRTIPVEYADVEEVADIIEDVFKDSMTPEQPQQQGGQGFNPLAMMFRGGMGGGGGAAAAAKKPAIELTLGVDKRTNHLIVSCNETVFRRVETMVKELDLRAKEARPTVRLVPLKTADPMVVQSTLTSLMPRVTVSATRSKRSKKADTPGTPGQPQAPDATRDAQMIQRMSPQNGGQPGGMQGGGRNFGGGGGGRNPGGGGGGMQNGGGRGGGGGGGRGGNGAGRGGN